jgi:hypothetical protein
MGKISCALLLLLLALPAYGADKPKREKEGKAFYALLSADVALTAADLATSQMAYRRGGHEVWMPYWYGYQPHAPRQAVQMFGEVILFESIAYLADRTNHHRLARLVQAARVGAQGSAVAMNAICLGRH